jgi:hypothetical protein
VSDIDESIPLLTEEIAFGKPRPQAELAPPVPAPMPTAAPANRIHTDDLDTIPGFNVDDLDTIPELSEAVTIGRPRREAAPVPAPISRPSPPAAAAAPAAPSYVQQPVTVPTPISAPKAVPAAAAPPVAPDWEALATEVRERVLRDLHERVDYGLEARIIETASAGLQLALRDMAEQLHQSLQQTMRELVTSAVAQEIARIRKEKFQQGELGI